MTDPVLETINLTKVFGRVVAVNEVNLKVSRGEVFGFLGPNGAGKTTTIGLLLGLLHPTAGRIELFGQPVSPGLNQPLAAVGSLVGKPAFFPYLSGRDNLRLLARMDEAISEDMVDEVLDKVGLTAASGGKFKTYSTGMKQRLGLAAALLAQPALIILDEPTNGLDPAGMREVRNLIASLAQKGITVFLSSHLLHEVEQICDRIAVINQGRIVVQDSVDHLLSRQEQVVKLRVRSPQLARQALESLQDVKKIDSNGAYVVIHGVESERIIAQLARQNIFPDEVKVQHSDLEELYISLTQTRM